MKNFYYSIANLSIYSLTLNLKNDNKLFKFDNNANCCNKAEYRDRKGNDSTYYQSCDNFVETLLRHHIVIFPIFVTTVFTIRHNGRSFRYLNISLPIAPISKPPIPVATNAITFV